MNMIVSVAYKAYITLAVVTEYISNVDFLKWAHSFNKSLISYYIN